MLQYGLIVIEELSFLSREVICKIGFLVISFFSSISSYSWCFLSLKSYKSFDESVVISSPDRSLMAEQACLFLTVTLMVMWAQTQTFYQSLSAYSFFLFDISCQDVAFVGV